MCPGSVEFTIGQPCAPQGFTCYPQYSCGIAPAIATCVCTGGAFACTDATGQALTTMTTPACPLPGKGSGACPAAEAIARVSNCTEPGLLCAYRSTCTDASFDECECFETQVDAGVSAMRFQCPAPCIDVGIVELPEAGPPVMDAQGPPPSADAGDASARDAGGGG